jgi:tetratricopeptide (TPR) repeat protein
MTMRIPGLIVLAFTSSVLAQAPSPSPKQLLEAGQYEEVAQAVASSREQGQVDPADTYLAAQSFLKLGQSDNAKGELARLLCLEGDAWKLIGQSSIALIDGDTESALETANQAVATAPEVFFAHYQLGLVKAEQQDWPGAAEAFERASQIDPTFAYAHYYAGLAYSKTRRVDRTATHFETFLKLAPKAPERPAVESVMRTLRGR